MSGHRFAINILQQCIGFVNRAVAVPVRVWHKCITIEQAAWNCYSDVMAIQVDRMNVPQGNVGIISVGQSDGNGASQGGNII